MEEKIGKTKTGEETKTLTLLMVLIKTFCVYVISFLIYANNHENLTAYTT